MLNRFAPFIAALVISLVYGMAAERFAWFPAPQLKFMVKEAMSALQLVDGKPKWYYVEGQKRQLVEDYKAPLTQPGLTLLTGVGPQDS